MSLSFIVAILPPIGWLAVVLTIACLVVIPLVFWGLGRTGKRGIAWAVIPIVAFVTSAGLWLYVNRQVVG